MRQASVNVRTLAEFCCLRGDIVPAGRALRRMREGAQAHGRLQRQYPEGWKSEVSLSRTLDVAGLRLTVHGRADGLGQDDFGPVIEEIKSYERDLPDGFAGVEAHWMQAIAYAAIATWQAGAPSACVRLVYVRGGETTALSRRMSAARLEEALFSLAERYAAFQGKLMDARQRARDSARALPFPYAAYRPGQRRLAGHAYFALTRGRNLMAQAPTGIGKTMAALYPAVRALGDGAIERIFYLTARTTQRRAAEDALERLRAVGLRLRAVTLTARDKICFCPDAACDPEACPYARGHFDRIVGALAEGLEAQALTCAAVESLARAHRVCPFELSLDLAELADAVICDYNYAFDPNVRLRRFFDGRDCGGALLIDEAHNLPDRVSGMLSAELDARGVRLARRAVGRHAGRKSGAYAALTDLLRALDAECAGAEQPFSAPNAGEALRDAVTRAAEALRRDVPAPDQAIADALFDLLDFERAAKSAAPEHTCALIEPRKGGCRVRLWRFDPSAHIRDGLKKARGALLFSATLSPLDYYMARCGLDADAGDAALSVPDPFPARSRLVLRAKLPMRYAERERSLPEVCRYLRAMADARAGNYMVCCPSHALLQQAADAFEAANPGVRVLRQLPSMTEEQRDALLEDLPERPTRATLAFVVMGGVFAEGVDLPGDRLSGAAILTVGLPQISFERDVLAHMPPPAGGYDVAYVAPSVARVAQAAGRVVRSEADRGVILLLDDRYERTPYRQLYGAMWRVEGVDGAEDAERRMRAFWAED